MAHRHNKLSNRLSNKLSNTLATAFGGGTLSGQLLNGALTMLNGALFLLNGTMATDQLNDAVDGTTIGFDIIAGSGATAQVRLKAGGVVGTFTNSTLVAGILDVTHSIAQWPVTVVIADNSGNVLRADGVSKIDANNIAVDLTSFGTLTGTYTYSVRP